MSFKKINRDRPVAPTHKFGIIRDWYQQLSWKQRLQILFGYRLVIRVRIACLHNPGEPTYDLLQVETTKEINPKEVPS